MKRLGVLLLALLLLAGAYLYGPRLLHMVKADLGDFSGSFDYGDSGSSSWDSGSSSSWSSSSWDSGSNSSWGNSSWGSDDDD